MVLIDRKIKNKETDFTLKLGSDSNWYYGMPA